MRFIFDDFDQYKEATRDWGFEFVQLDRGAFRGELQQSLGFDVTMSHFNFNRRFHQQGQLSLPGRTFAVFLNRPSWMRWHGAPVVWDSIVIFPRDGSFDATTVPHFDAVSITITEALLETAARLAGLEHIHEALPDAQGLWCCDPGALMYLRSQVRVFLEHPVIPASVWKEVELVIAVSILSSIDTRSSCQKRRHGSRMRDRAFDRALECIRATDGILTIPELAVAAGASERTLRYAFIERLGVPPKAYIKARALQQARRALVVAGPDEENVSLIAAQHGFWHLGQFSSDYKRMFAELPSTTLSRHF